MPWALPLLLSLGAACGPTVPDAPPQKAALSVLVCADSEPAVFAELKAKYSRLDVSRIADNPECVRGKAAAVEIGHTCIDDELGCTTPSYVDGKPIASPTSAYDSVMLFTQLLHGSLSAKTVTTTRVVTTGAAGAATGGRGSRGSPGKTVTENDIVPTGETDYTGELFLFEPRPGRLHIGKRFRNLAPDRLLDLMRELLHP
jgi:hypothetical protein